MELLVFIILALWIGLIPALWVLAAWIGLALVLGLLSD